MQEVKIKKVDVENLKAIDQFTAVFDGKCAHVTGSNGVGKSTVIRTLTDRLRGLKPSIVTKIGESKGKTIMELTDGCRFEWEYNKEGKDSLNYFTPDSLKPVRRDVFKSICNQYFPNQFDINKFLTTTEPRKRLQMISELVDIDLTEVQLKYKDAFDKRKEAKKDLKTLEAQIMPRPETGIFENLEKYCDEEQANVSKLYEAIEKSRFGIETERKELNSEYTKNKAENDKKLSEHNSDYQLILSSWIEKEAVIKADIEAHNTVQGIRTKNIEERGHLLNQIGRLCKDTVFEKFFDENGAVKLIRSMPQPELLKVYESSQQPAQEPLNLPDPMPKSGTLDQLKKYLEALEIEFKSANVELDNKKAELNDLKASRKVFDLQMKQYDDYKSRVRENSDYVHSCEIEVEKVLNEIKALISSTDLPAEFTIDLTEKNDILFRTSEDAEYLPITNETLASSAIFIAAFKLQANYLQSFRVAHFDVSYLDFENRQKVLQEAIKMNIQLITESPAHDESTKMLQSKITE